MKGEGAFRRVRCAKGARGSANERRSPFSSLSFSNACYAGYFPLERVSIKESSHFCKGSNVKSAPKTSVHSLPEQGLIVRKVNNAISLSGG